MYSVFVTCLLISGLIAAFPLYTDAGSCWAQYNFQTGMCRTLLSQNITSDDCCSENPGGAYSEEHLSRSQLFWFVVMHHSFPRGLPCSSFRTSSPCEDVECYEERQCEIKENKPQCVCRHDCLLSELNGPVCGSDNKNYNSECDVRTTRCLSSKALEAAYRGPCRDSCSDVHCLFGKRCFEGTGIRPFCVSCWFNCEDPGEDASVCGLDGITYESRCHMRIQSCFVGRAIGRLHYGRCAGSTTCETMSCLDKKICVENEGMNPRCLSCNVTKCSEDNELRIGPICGTDGVSYASSCYMIKQMCSTRISIKRRSYGVCVDDPNYRLAQQSTGNPEMYFRYYVALFSNHHPVSTKTIAELGLDEEVLARIDDHEKVVTMETSTGTD